MNLIIQIQGREAIPVRAIPLLTNWRFFTPDVVAQVLAGDKELDGFVVGTLQAFHFQDGAVTAFPKTWWESWAARELRACSETIKSNQPSPEPGYQQWRDESLPLLPAGAFVWKDEFVRLHAQNRDRRIRLFGRVNSCDSEDEQNSPISRKLAAFVDEGLTSLEEWRELDFSPYVRPALWSVVMEGVPPQQAAPSLAAAAAASAEMSDPAKVERKAKLDEALRKIKTASVAYAESDAEVEELLSHREDAKARLARREEVLSNASALGDIKNLEDAEMAVSASKQAVKMIEERIRVMRGDYTESYQAPQTTTPSPAPVESDDTGPPPLTTGDIAFCFAGLRWPTEKAWKKPLGDKPKWLATCVVTEGVRGVSERRWSPVCIGAALVRGGHAKVNSVRAKFQTMPLLTPWLEEWKIYEADNFYSH